MVIIRKAKLKEVPEIVKLWKEFMKDHREIINSRTKYFTVYQEMKKSAPDNFKSYVSRNIRSKNGTVFVAEDNGKLAGYSLIIIKKNIPIFKVEKYGYINDLFVKKAYRRQKIASQFKELAIKWFKDKGIKHAGITVHTNNPKAHAIYNKWGFRDFHQELRKKI